MGELINRIPGQRLLISSLPGLALRTLVESLGKLLDSTSLLEALLGKFDITRQTLTLYSFFHSSSFYVSRIGKSWDLQYLES